MLKGNLDAVIQDKLVGEYILHQNNLEGIRAVFKPLATRTAHIAVAKGNSALLKEITRAITEVKLKGELENISRRWSGTAPVQPIQIIVGSELDYPPYALVTENGEADGFSVDLIPGIPQRLCQVEFYKAMVANRF